MSNQNEFNSSQEEVSGNQEKKLPQAPKIYFKDTYQSRYDSINAIYFDIKLKSSGEIIKGVKCSTFEIIDQENAEVQVTQYKLNEYKIKPEDCKSFIDDRGTEWKVDEVGEPRTLDRSRGIISIIVPSDKATDKSYCTLNLS